MPQFIINHVLRLSEDKLLSPGDRYGTEDEGEVADLRKRAAYGACTEVKPAEAKQEAAPAADPKDDISVVPGVGKKVMEKLAEAAIASLSGLRAAMLDAAQEEKMKGLLGLNYDKILKYFKPE